MWIVWCYLLRRDLIWLSGEHMRCGFSGSCRCSGGTPRLTVLEQYTHAVLRGRVVDAPKPPSRRTAYRLVHVPQATKNTKTWRKLGELRRKLDEYLSRAIRAADPTRPDATPHPTRPARCPRARRGPRRAPGSPRRRARGPGPSRSRRAHAPPPDPPPAAHDARPGHIPPHAPAHGGPAAGHTRPRPSQAARAPTAHRDRDPRPTSHARPRRTESAAIRPLRRRRPGAVAPPGGRAGGGAGRVRVSRSRADCAPRRARRAPAPSAPRRVCSAAPVRSPRRAGGHLRHGTTAIRRRSIPDAIRQTITHLTRSRPHGTHPAPAPGERPKPAHRRRRTLPSRRRLPRTGRHP